MNPLLPLRGLRLVVPSRGLRLAFAQIILWTRSHPFCTKGRILSRIISTVVAYSMDKKQKHQLDVREALEEITFASKCSATGS
jgi:GTP-sensing pleiotropic transcriptional regulator CodY